MDLSYSQISTWKFCRMKWYYRYVRKLEPISRVPKMDLGVYGHRLLEAHYKGEDLVKVSQQHWEEETESLFDEELEQFQETREMAEWLVARYIEHYAGNDWEPLAVEEKFRVNIPTEKGTRSRDNLRGILDVIVDDNGEIWLVDHKFTATDLEKYDDGLVLDEQANFYLWALRELLDRNVAGIIFNLIRTKKPTVPKLLKNGTLSVAKNMDTTRATYLQAIIDNGLDPADYVDALQHVEETEKAFLIRHKVYRTDSELDDIGRELRMVARDIHTGEIFRNAANCVRDHQYKELCIMDRKQLDTTFYRSRAFNIRGEVKQ